MIVIKIRRVEIIKEYFAFIDLKKLDRRKKYFVFLNQKRKRRKKNMLHELESLTALTPQICQIWVLRTPVIGLFIKVRI